MCCHMKRRVMGILVIAISLLVILLMVHFAQSGQSTLASPTPDAGSTIVQNDTSTSQDVTDLDQTIVENTTEGNNSSLVDTSTPVPSVDGSKQSPGGKPPGDMKGMPANGKPPNGAWPSGARPGGARPSGRPPNGASTDDGQVNTGSGATHAATPTATASTTTSSTQSQTSSISSYMASVIARIPTIQPISIK